MTRHHLPPLNTLPAFVAVAKYLSFSKAANSLHVTHSAISQSIKLLEKFLSQKLFTRNAGGVILTKAGKEYYFSIQAALNIIEESTQNQFKTFDNNILTINIMTTLAIRWLIPRLPRFQEEYPHIDLRISTLGREVDFKDDNIDVAISYGQDNWPGVSTKKLFNDQLILISSCKLADIKKNPVNVIIKKYKAIYVNAELRQHDWAIWCKKARLDEPKKDNRIYFQSSTQALQAVSSGLGIMVTHIPFVRDEIKTKQLIMLSNVMPTLIDSYYFISPSDTFNKENVIHFRKWLLKEINLL